jgi:hypothetical protein
MVYGWFFFMSMLSEVGKLNRICICIRRYYVTVLLFWDVWYRQSVSSRPFVGTLDYLHKALQILRSNLTWLVKVQADYWIFCDQETEKKLFSALQSCYTTIDWRASPFVRQVKNSGGQLWQNKILRMCACHNTQNLGFPSFAYITCAGIGIKRRCNGDAVY